MIIWYNKACSAKGLIQAMGLKDKGEKKNKKPRDLDTQASAGLSEGDDSAGAVDIVLNEPDTPEEAAPPPRPIRSRSARAQTAQMADRFDRRRCSGPAAHPAEAPGFPPRVFRHRGL
jgi:hypothetical protein